MELTKEKQEIVTQLETQIKELDVSIKQLQDAQLMLRRHIEDIQNEN
tara:strand:+ start:273 stop:413 length:141 start_codon:yes stop_codon:yes gene_type:complete